jgi:biopolymer transport protein ExbB
MRLKTYSIACSLMLLGLPFLRGETLPEMLGKASLNYAQRIEAATKELSTARERIAKEKTPLIQATNAASERITALESEITRLETAQSRAQERRQKLQRDLDTLRKNLNYITTATQDGLKNMESFFLPGEAALYNERLLALRQKIENSTNPLDVSNALDSMDLIVERMQRLQGGYVAKGSSIVGEDNQIVKGTFAFAGPEVFFHGDQGDLFGTVRLREGSLYPVTYALRDWKSERALPLFEGKKGSLFADPSSGKALRLRETKGTLYEHIDKGGVVAYIIIGVGLFSIAICITKLRDLKKLTLDEPQAIHATLKIVAQGSKQEAEKAIESLQTATRELYLIGLRYLDQPKALIEEHLHAYTQKQRLYHERRLPLLAVIVTASPLLGLLGTVMGMTKTFTLITVFGTGNAAKLSSGISEVLVCTELGLMVAVPTLVMHSILSNRAHNRLALLERYSSEFIIASEESKQARKA